MNKTTCVIEDCDSEEYTRNWCIKHYWRFRRHGDPLGTKTKETIGEFLTCKLCKLTQKSDQFLSNDSRRKNTYVGKCKTCRAFYHRFIRYGLNVEQATKLIESAQGKCMMCFMPTEKLYIDHDHACCNNPKGTYPVSCGKCIRGLICHHCNALLGFARDNKETLLMGVEYLSKRKL